MGTETKPTATPALDDFIGASVKRWRLLSGLTQEAVTAEMVKRGFEFHQSTLYKIESGKRRVLIGEAVALAEVLGVPLESLISPDTEAEVTLLTQAKLGARLELEALERAHEALNDARMYHLSIRRGLHDLHDIDKPQDFGGVKASFRDFYKPLGEAEPEVKAARETLARILKSTQKIAEYVKV